MRKWPVIVVLLGSAGVLVWAVLPGSKDLGPLDAGSKTEFIDHEPMVIDEVSAPPTRKHVSLGAVETSPTHSTGEPRKRQVGDWGAYAATYWLNYLETPEGKATTQVHTDPTQALRRLVGLSAIKYSDLTVVQADMVRAIVSEHDKHLSENKLLEQKSRWTGIQNAIREGRFVEVPNGEGAAKLRELMDAYPGDSTDKNGTVTAGPDRTKQRVIMFTRRNDSEWFMHRENHNTLVALRDGALRDYIRSVR